MHHVKHNFFRMLSGHGKTSDLPGRRTHDAWRTRVDVHPCVTPAGLPTSSKSELRTLCFRLLSLPRCHPHVIAHHFRTLPHSHIPTISLTLRTPPPTPPPVVLWATACATHPRRPLAVDATMEVNEVQLNGHNPSDPRTFDLKDCGTFEEEEFEESERGTDGDDYNPDMSIEPSHR